MAVERNWNREKQLTKNYEKNILAVAPETVGEYFVKWSGKSRNIIS